MKKPYKHLTEENYDQIKLLQGAGLKQSLIVAATGRTSSTVSQVVNSETFAGYRETQRNRREKSKPTSKLSQVTANDLDVIHTLQAINDSLVNIDRRLQFLEEHIPVKPKSRWSL